MKMDWKSLLQNLAVTAAIIGAFVIGTHRGKEELKQEASRLGLGNYYVDDSFTIQWKWNSYKITTPRKPSD